MDEGLETVTGTGVWLNGRHALEWELPAVERAAECERERDARVLAGVLTAEVVPRPEVPRPVTDLVWEFS